MSKVVLVTGASSGIGKATVELFASRGFDVVINYNSNEVNANSIASEIRESYGVRVLCIKADVSNELEVKEMVDKAILEFGHIDVLVNNAGILDEGLAAINKFNDEDLDRVIQINQKGTMYCMRAALKHMLPAQTGSIVNVASVAGYNGGGGAAYVSSKAAIIGITKHAAMRTAASHIRCNVLCPGNILTPMTAGMNFANMDMEMFGAMAAHADLKNCPSCTAEDVANVLLFLASDESKPITGQTIVCDFGANL